MKGEFQDDDDDGGQQLLMKEFQESQMAYVFQAELKELNIFKVSLEVDIMFFMFMLLYIVGMKLSSSMKDQEEFEQNVP